MSRFSRILDAGVEPGITAVLGPTNTGKTHRAIERMLGHPTGMIGLPLRLLAREVYDRLVRARGAEQVALVTGEEKRIPAKPRYFVCTVEAMPVNRRVSFLAVDEIQLVEDPARGHVFTERLLEARGLVETWFLGSDRVESVLRELVPTAVIERHPRFSRLSYAGPSKLVRLPPRSAVVAFSARELYRIADALRARHGGVAVVLGALSPRTRNAQVEMYQSGEVKYLVATDAIGMGLNMDVDHVAFAGTHKFDGRRTRALSAAEIGQIAGRAGRFRRDGTFGETAGLEVLPREVVEAVEGHRFAPIRRLVWRNADLDFSSLRGLRRSLARRPHHPLLRSVSETVDGAALESLAADSEIALMAKGRVRIELLWDVVRIPDFEKTLTGTHVKLLGTIYRHLCGREGALPERWIAAQVEGLDRKEGDIETLMARIARVRTWTFIANRSDWVSDSERWKARTRAIEDRLSDALHEQLVRRFVDRRVMRLTEALRRDLTGEARVADDGSITVLDVEIGRIEGLVFHPVAHDTDAALAKVARAAAAEPIRRRALELVEADADALSARGREIRWKGSCVGRVRAGPHLMEPRVQVPPTRGLEPAIRRAIQLRLERWVAVQRDGILHALRGATTGGARGLAAALESGLGTARRKALRENLRELTRRDREALDALGIRVGRETVFSLELLAPEAMSRRAALACAWWPELPSDVPWGVPSWPAGEATVSAWLAVGYARLGSRAVRVDILEDIADWAWRGTRSGRLLELGIEPILALGCDLQGASEVFRGLGYRTERSESGARIRRAR